MWTSCNIFIGTDHQAQWSPPRSSRYLYPSVREPQRNLFCHLHDELQVLMPGFASVTPTTCDLLSRKRYPRSWHLGRQSTWSWHLGRQSTTTRCSGTRKYDLFVLILILPVKQMIQFINLLLWSALYSCWLWWIWFAEGYKFVRTALCFCLPC